MVSPKFYLAARFQDIREARSLRDRLQANGLVCTSNWLKEPENDDPDYTIMTDRLTEHAHRDLADICEADVFILYNPHNRRTFGSGGCHFETGYAWSQMMLIFVLGQRSNIFHHLDGVELFSDTEDGFQRLVAAAKDFVR